MDIPRLAEMNRYWDKHPPLHLMVAAYLGIKPQPQTQPNRATVNTPEDLQEFVQLFSAAGGAVR